MLSAATTPVYLKVIGGAAHIHIHRKGNVVAVDLAVLDGELWRHQGRWSVPVSVAPSALKV